MSFLPLDALVMLEVRMSGVAPPALCWHNKKSGEKLQTGFLLAAELDGET